MKQVEEEYDIAGVQWLMKDKGPKIKGKGKDKAAKPEEHREPRSGDTERWTDQEGRRFRISLTWLFFILLFVFFTAVSRAYFVI